MLLVLSSPVHGAVDVYVTPHGVPPTQDTDRVISVRGHLIGPLVAVNNSSRLRVCENPLQIGRVVDSTGWPVNRYVMP